MDDNPTLKMLARSYADLRVHERYDDAELNDMHVAALKLSLRYAWGAQPSPYRLPLPQDADRDATTPMNADDCTDTISIIPTVSPHPPRPPRPPRKWKIVGQL